MKKFVGKALPLAAAIAAVSAVTVFAAVKNRFPVFVDGKSAEIAGYNIDDRTYFQLSDLAEKLGFEQSFKNDRIMISTAPSPIINVKSVAGSAQKLSDDSWGEFFGADVKKVIFVSAADKAALTVSAVAGWFLSPNCGDEYDASEQFVPIKGGGGERVFSVDEGAEFLFRACDESPSKKPAKLTFGEFAQKAAEGYEMWEVTAKGGKITSLSNIQWKEETVYRVDGVILSGTMARASFTPIKRVIAPFLLDNYRMDETGVPAETLWLTAATEILAVDLEGKNILTDTKRVTAAELAKMANGRLYVSLKKSGARAVEIREIFLP